MAHEGSAATHGSQLFFVFQDSTSGLTASYTPFATVSSGLDIVQNVAKDGYSCQYAQAGGGAPKEKGIIQSVTISKTWRARQRRRISVTTAYPEWGRVDADGPVYVRTADG